MWPTAVLIFITVVILTVWSVLYGLDWEREIIDPVTGESIAFCHGDSTSIWLISCIPITILPILLVGYMAWKTKVRAPVVRKRSLLLIMPVFQFL